jgi:hypothetical protein
MKTITSILSEIGFPFTKRFINFQLKFSSIETVMLCDYCLFSFGTGTELLEQLQAFCIVRSKTLQDALHTSLKQ